MPKQRMFVGKRYWWLLGAGMLMVVLAIAWRQSRPIGQDIFFISNRDGFYEIYVMNADGSGQTRLTQPSPFYNMAILVRRWYSPPILVDYLRESTEHKMWFALSPDGKRIAFQCQRKSRPHICVMNADGSDLAVLRYEGRVDLVPTWSPDGDRIIFISWQESGQGWESQIFVASADGRHVGPLTSFKADHVNYYLAWSPDGQKIAFSLRNIETENMNIYLMNPDGSNVVQLTNGEVDTQAAWSPDSKQIAYIASPENSSERYLLNVVNVDGTNPRLLTPNPDFYSSPIWSPDASQIAFRCGRDICVINANGTNLIKLTHDDAFDSLPNWSPDGQRIVFTRQSPGGIFVINADGSKLTPLTDHPSIYHTYGHPIWRK